MPSATPSTDDKKSANQPPHGLASVFPWDEHNQRWVSNVHPGGWENPDPVGRYNMLVIGAGPAGLVTALGAAGLGAKVALVEKHLLGGDCLNVGCVPSKALIHAGKRVSAAARAADLGVDIQLDNRAVGFGAAMRRLRKIRADLSRHDSAERLSSLGVDVFIGTGKFTGPKAFEIDGKRIEFSRCCIATGARAEAPSIPGLDKIEYLTNENVFTLTERPSSLGVIGAGPVGCELGQAFARFGVKTYLFESMHGILPREDRDAAAIVADSLRRDGVEIICCSRELMLSPVKGGGKRIEVVSHDNRADLTVDTVLVAVGRAPNVENLGLEEAGVNFQKSGIVVDDRLRTSNPRIFAAGDVASRLQFTHAADAMARIVIGNALFAGRGKVSRLIVPWATYTEPELGHVGMTSQEIEKAGVHSRTFTVQLSDVDRAVIDGEDSGFVRVHADRKGRILGATIVASHAGDLIAEISMAMTNGIRLGRIARSIHPYPTQSEAIRKVGDAFNRARLTPFFSRLAHAWLSLRR